MICPNCKTNIPNDSKFCPDCGTTIHNIDSLRTDAKGIVNKYPRGYEALVECGILPHWSEYLSAEGYEIIIKTKDDIIRRNTEICNNSLSLSTNIIDYENSGRFYRNVTVNSKCNCTITVDSDWIHLGENYKQGYSRYVSAQTITKGEITIHVDKNSGNKRIGYVIASNGYVTKKITIVQEGGFVETENENDLYTLIGHIIAWVIGIGLAVCFFSFSFSK